MIFKRKLHDGLWGVICRTDKKTITFSNGKYETDDEEECLHLIDLGYDYEGDLPEAKKDEKQKVK